MVIGLSVTAVIVSNFLIAFLVFICIGRCRQQTEQNQQTQGVCSTLRPTFGLIFICYFFNSLQLISMKSLTCINSCKKNHPCITCTCNNINQNQLFQHDKRKEYKIACWRKLEKTYSNLQYLSSFLSFLGCSRVVQSSKFDEESNMISEV